MAGGADLLSRSKAIKAEVDQAVVSLVDKERMRAKQANIADTLKAWLKASEAERTAQATAVAEALATKAAADGDVS
jgi:hypothetical protein